MATFQISLDSEYASAIGRTMFIFATYEWNIAWCGDKLSPGFLRQIKGETSGKIGFLCQQIVEEDEILDTALRGRLLAAIKDFRCAVKERNALIHGKPCTDREGRQLLSNSDAAIKYWSKEAVDGAALMFETGSIEVNAILHTSLMQNLPYRRGQYGPQAKVEL